MTTPEEFLRIKAQHNVDTGSNKGPSNFAEASEKAEATNFLSNLKSDLRIGNIYYPGCSDDSILEPVFTGHITYLDDRIVRRDAGKLGFLSNFMSPPKEIVDNSFDAAFIKDLHLHLKEDGQTASPSEKLEAILRKVKTNGTIIYGIRRACPEWEGELGFLSAQTNLRNLQLPYSNPNFKVFFKISI